MIKKELTETTQENISTPNNTITRISQIKESVIMTPDLMEGIQKSCIHYLNSNPEEFRKIVENTVKEILSINKILIKDNVQTNENIELFVREITKSNTQIKTVICKDYDNHFSVIVIHDYSNTGKALNEIEPLLTKIEDEFETTNFDFNVIHTSNMTSNVVPSST